MKKLSAKHRTRFIAGWPSASPLPPVEDYEDRLERDREWAMEEGSKFFQGTSETHRSLKKITQRLADLGIDYVVVGGMALFQHGYRRFTDDVDLLVTPEGLKEIHRKLEGLGYLPPFEGSKHLRDMEHGVKIEFLLTGEFPGDGKPKPVAFPIPASVATEIGGMRCINLPALIELKLASGMTNPERIKDLADVIELIKALNLAKDFAETPNPFVRVKYEELWKDAHPSAKRYISRWRNKLLTADAKSLQDMIGSLQSAADTLRLMLVDGVTLHPERGVSDDYVYLVTSDPVIAKKYDMHDETEFWGVDRNDGAE